MWSAKKDGDAWVVEHLSGDVLERKSRFVHLRRPVTFKSREAAEKRAAKLNAKS